MIKTPSLLIGCLLLIVCFACEKPVEKVTPNGFKFSVVKAGDGILPKPNQLLVFDFTVSDSKDSVWNSSYDSGIPAIVPIGDTSRLDTETGMFQMFRMLSAADSVNITAAPEPFFRDVYGAVPPPGMDSTMQMHCRIRVRKIIEMQDQREYMEKLFAERKPKQKAKDLKKIDDYLAKHNVTAQKDTSGISYVIHKSAGGSKPAPGSCVQVSYEGLFLENERMFDKNDNVAFSLQQVVPGWQYGIPLLAVGDSATLYIPSHLAYGPEGRPGAIPGDAILIFNVKLLATGPFANADNTACSDVDPMLQEQAEPEAKKKASK